MLSQVIRREEFGFADDETYQGYADETARCGSQSQRSGRKPRLHQSRGSRGNSLEVVRTVATPIIVAEPRHRKNVSRPVPDLQAPPAGPRVSTQ